MSHYKTLHNIENIMSKCHTTVSEYVSAHYKTLRDVQSLSVTIQLGYMPH